MLNLIREHIKRYPLMTMQDVVKIIYQQEFGGGHLITDEEESLQRLQAEYAETPKEDKVYVEDIGNDVVRVYLGGLKEEQLPELNRLFVKAANEKEINHFATMAFAEKVDGILLFVKCGELPFTVEEAEGYVKAYRAEKCPPVSHSVQYHDAYRPAYRILPAAYAKELLGE